MTNENLKHLEFIQNVITRMNGNSFQIKTWTVTIVSALLAIYASTQNNYFILAALFPTIVFWFLDSYYLMQERKFRGLYNDVAGISSDPREIKVFEMRPDLYVRGRYSFISVFFSITILQIYLSLILLLATLFVIFEYWLTRGG